MLRHTAFFMFREGVTPEQRLTMLKGLAYMRYECPSVLHLDYGTDIFGGSREMYGVKPYRRTPRWRSRKQGPPANFDVALHLDFADAEGNEAYNDHPVHHEVADYNASICEAELTARVDWHYEDGYLTRPGHVRHCEMFVWDDDVTDDAKQVALDRTRRLEAAPEVEAVVIGRNVGTLPTDFDWILDVHVPNEQACKQLLGGDLYADVMREVASLTKHEWTARLSHVMRGL
jgi:hypothetical protein